MKMAPATMTPDEAPIDWMMTFCPSMFFLPISEPQPTAMMAIGMAASKTWPTFRPRKAAAAEKMTAITRPIPTE